MWQKKHSKKTAELLDVSALKRKAVDLLARREYSYAELEKKLLPVAESEESAYIALDWLVENQLQSDQRFCEMFLRSKALSGYGPIRIRMELKQKGLQTDLIDLTFEQEEIDWQPELDRLVEKKLNGVDEKDVKIKQKCMAFLQRRGFNLDQIYAALERRAFAEDE